MPECEDMWIMWNPAECTDEENERWCLLRAMEWGSWPMFMSQPIAPLLMLVWPWPIVVFATVVANVLWAFFIRYNAVVPAMAYWGAFFFRLKWIACPLAACLLYLRGEKLGAAFALFWPWIAAFGQFPAPMVGRIQKMFMRCLGYEPTEENPLS